VDFANVSAMAGKGEEMGLMKYVPWWMKVVVKLILSKLPFSYRFWQRIGIFRHGQTDDPERAIRTFEKYFKKASEHRKLGDGFTCLELGPGDSLLTGGVASAFGAKAVWLVDAGPFANTNTGDFNEVIHKMQNKGRKLPLLSNANSLSETLVELNIHYLTNGTDSLKEIPEGAVDFFWSQVVLEHVSKADFPEFVRQLRRVASPDAIGVHSIDFRDHLSGGLNNLRFTDKIWEGAFFNGAGFYTNRLRPREIIQLFQHAGFATEILSETRWENMPIERRSLAPEFNSMPDEDFMVAEIELLVRPTELAEY